MNKKVVKIFQGIVFILIIMAFIYVGTLDFTQKEIVDNERFDQEYTMVSSENVFIYVNAREVYSALKGNAIIFMGYPSNKWTGYYASVLNEAAKAAGITEVLYYDFHKDRENKNATYQSIIMKLSNYITALDDGTRNLYAPTLVVVKNGSIIYFDNETGFVTGNIEPSDYWNELKIGLKTNSLKTMLEDYLSN